MSVKISWLRIACDIFGMSQRHLTSLAIMEEIDYDEHCVGTGPILTPARLAMHSNAVSDDVNELGDVFISEYRRNWNTPSVMELPPKSRASAVCAWLSTLHLILDRYSAPCGVYLTTPVCLRIPSINVDLPGSMYVDSVRTDQGPGMYLLVAASQREAVVCAHRHSELHLKINNELWITASSNVYSQPDDVAGVWLASPFGYNIILRGSNEDEGKDVLHAELTYFDPDGEQLVKKWLT